MRLRLIAALFLLALAANPQSNISNSAGTVNVQQATAGSLKVDLSGTAANSTALNVAESGTWTVQPGDTANTTPWLTTDSGTSTTGSAVPAKAHYLGGNAGGNLAGVTVCNSYAQLQMTTATTTQIVALVSGQRVRVCAYAIQGSTTSTATTLKLVYGTGTACATGAVNLTPAWNLTATSTALPFTQGMGLGELFQTAASNALCATSSAAGTVNISVTYTQY